MDAAARKLAIRESKLAASSSSPRRQTIEESDRLARTPRIRDRLNGLLGGGGAHDDATDRASDAHSTRTSCGCTG